MTREEYFAQDIIARLQHAQVALDDGDDPIVFRDEGVGITVRDVIHDAIVEIKRLRGDYA